MPEETSSAETAPLSTKDALAADVTSASVAQTS
jgi:hypothetical protein